MPKGVFANPEERRRKISESQKGRKQSEEHRRNGGLARKGLKRSDETKKKMSEARLGRNPEYPNGAGTYFRNLARKIWERHYGVKVPIDKRTGRSMLIHHRDFNYENNAWQNLGLVSETVHPKIHAEHNKNLGEKNVCNSTLY